MRLHAEHRREHGIKPVSDVGKARRRLFVAESHERKCQSLVRTVGCEHVFRLYSQIVRYRFYKALRLGVVVQPQPFRNIPHRVENRGAGAEKRLVRVQFYVLFVLRLFARNVRVERFQPRGCKPAHLLTFTAFACACKPSDMANASILSAASSSAPFV